MKANLTLPIIVLFLSGIHTVIVYLYQVLCLDFTGLKEKIREKDNFFWNNLPTFGLTIYQNENIYYCLLPHYFTNFLALLYINRISNFHKEIKRKSKKIIFIKDEEKKTEIKESEENDEIKEDIIKGDEEKIGDDDIAEDIKNKANTLYNKNISKIKLLNIKYIISLIVITFTELYWIVLFIVTGIIFTFKDLSIGNIIYIFMFGISFIIMFKTVIMKLSNFMSKETYFLSKLIRYQLAERENNFKNYQYHRDISFHYLLGYSLLLILLFYIYGIFDIFQNGCNDKLWSNCEKDRYSPIFDKDSKAENVIISVSYLFGFYVNTKKIGILEASWPYLLLTILIMFYLYIQKIGFYLFLNNFNNRKEYRNLINKNIRLKTIISMEKEKIIEDENIKNQVEESIIVKSENLLTSNKERIKEKYETLLNKIKIKMNQRNLNISEEDKKKGQSYIIKFLETFSKASSNKTSLSEKKNKYLITSALKKIFEELIILLMICTSIAKLNAWSFIYIIISINLILTAKTMKKYYHIFCFTIIALFAQLIVFISNLNKNTDPNRDEAALEIINKTFNIPWYKGNIKYGFFYGFGTSKNQINLIWMDLIDIIVLYIYLFYFSYCIYQDTDNIGQSKDINDKINYYNLRTNEKFYNCIKSISDEEFKEYKECMKYNLGINIDDIKNKLGIIAPKIELALIPPEEGRYLLDVGERNNNSNSDNLIDDNKKEKDKKEDENKESKMEEMKLEWSFIFGNLIELLSLSFHNIILIIIIIISMMVPGLLSLFYIIMSLYFLLTSSRMYLGKKYYYPKAIKKILRIAIIIDIAIQILYQMPVFYIGNKEKTTLDKILDIIGFNRIINYGEGDDIDYKKNDEIEINIEQMILVFCKAFTYFFMGIQILIYSSQNFQEHYLVYIVTRKIDLKRKSLINAFRFNNKRIQVMNKSIELREEMSSNMDKLKGIIETWNEKLKKKEKINEKDKGKKENLRGKKEKIYEDKVVKEYIKKLILNKKLIRFKIWFYKYAIDYSKINPSDKKCFEKDIIQGHTTVKTFIEKKVDIEVDKLNLGNFSEKEMVELKKFFVNTEEQMKVLEKQKMKKLKEKEKKIFAKIIKGVDIPSSPTSEIDEIRKEKTKMPIIDLTQYKFKEIENLLKSDLFKIYLKTSYLIKSLIMDLLAYISKKFHFVCYFIMILNHIQNESLISMVFPISIFCFAIFEYPRPSKSYWNFCIIYSIIVLAIKYVLQLQLLVEIFGYENNAVGEEGKSSVYVELIKNLEFYKIGLKYMESTYGYKFFRYIIFDALIIIFLLINNLLLIINGLWDQREQEIENIYYALERVTKTKNLSIEEIVDINKFNDHFLELDRKRGTLKIKKYEVKQLGFFKKLKKAIINNEEEEDDNTYITIDTYSEKNKNYFKRLFPIIRNEKPGNDFYVYYTIGMILVNIYILIFYTSMVKDLTYDTFNQANTQFSGSMIIYLVLHIFFLCYDRVLYISQNRNNIKNQYIIYDRRSMEQIPEKDYPAITKKLIKKYEFDDDKEEKEKKENELKSLKEKYEIVNIHKEEFNKNLLQKYILHMFIVLAGHAFIFFYAPMKGNYNLNHYIFCSKDNEGYDECNDFNDNPSLIWFYIIYLIYFTFSGMQIKFGYYDMKRKSLLKSGYSTVNKIINTVFKSIPNYQSIGLLLQQV